MLIDEIKLAYIAGYVDSDGYIGIQFVKSREEFRPVLTITASRRDILESIADDLPIKCYIWTGKNERNAKRNHSKLIISDRKVYVVCKLILPFLRLKRRQAELIIEMYENAKTKNGRKTRRKNGKYFETFRPFYDKMIKLNEENKSPLLEGG